MLTRHLTNETHLQEMPRRQFNSAKLIKAAKKGKKHNRYNDDKEAIA